TPIRAAIPTERSQGGREPSIHWPAPSKALSATRLKTNIAVLNGTPREGLAEEAASLLRAAGWTVWQVGDADRKSYLATEILTRSSQAGQAPILGQVLKVSALDFPVWSQPRQPGIQAPVDYVVILGQDFKAALRIGSPLRP
ncbi:MAG: LytR C-terminal domain-containing protein, partial [Cyanobacteria bacterium REEB65]|nr:LytR C-terminal domain-containing protein [Cyanobacteria bacterium REEB65]